MNTAASSILSMTNITRTFHDANGRIDVLKGVNLTIQPGEFVIITGPSGSGKTTVLNIVAMLDRQTGGTWEFGGRNVAGMSDIDLCRTRGREIGMVFQKFHLLPYRSAFENVLFRWRYVEQGRDDPREASTQALAKVGLAGVSHRQARFLSSGEMQRVAIARAVALRPTLLVADEPTGNLDSSSATAIMQCFKDLNSDGLTILMVTHNEHLLGYGTRHLVCRDGVLLRPGKAP